MDGELKTVEEVDAAIADGRIRTLGDLVRAFPRAAFDLGVEDDLPRLLDRVPAAPLQASMGSVISTVLPKKTL